MDAWKPKGAAIMFVYSHGFVKAKAYMVFIVGVNFGRGYIDFITGVIYNHGYKGSIAGVCIWPRL